MMAHPALRRLAFVDTETTGLDPALDRIVEIGVVTLDGGPAEEWTALLNPRTSRALSSRLLQEVGEDEARALPRFGEVAQALLQRLGDGLLVAHNARFDYAFLKAEFERVGIRFEAKVVCSLALSRKLYEHHDRHDLASLVEHHGLTPDIRHRALPDARTVFELWQRFHRDHPPEKIRAIIQDLLVGPLLPAGLNPTLINRLPEKPGVFVLHGVDGPLHVGRAGNLRLHLTNFFRLDRISDRSAAWIDSIVDITWQVASGDLGARLQRVAVARAVLAERRRRDEVWSWRFDPRARPALALNRLAEGGPCDDCFGLFQSERKARNALSRLAAAHALCLTLLGVPGPEETACASCHATTQAGTPLNLRHLERACAALLPWKLAHWPYAGPIAVRERRTFHVVDRWHYLGAARSAAEIHALLEERPPPFDPEIYSVLTGALRRVSCRRVAHLQRVRPDGHCDRAAQ